MTYEWFFSGLSFGLLHLAVKLLYMQLDSASAFAACVFLSTMVVPMNSLAYQVEEGDTLSEIAAEQVGRPIFGEKGSLKKVLEKNPQLTNPDLIFPGTVLDLDEAAPIEVPQVDEAADGIESAVEVKPGDELVSIVSADEDSKEEAVLTEPEEELKSSVAVMRKESGGESQWFLHGGLGALWIDFDGGARLPQIPFRLGVGYELSSWSAELFYRASLFRLSDAVQGRPQWLRFSFGRSFEGLREGGLRNTYRILLGVERYSNTNVTASQSFNYIQEAYSFSAGFSSHFDLTKRWTIGGIALLGLINTESYRGMIQGNLEYSYSLNWALGGGYWFDYYSYVTSGSRNIEKQFALESYVKYYF